MRSKAKSARSAYRCVHCSVGAYFVDIYVFSGRKKSCQKRDEKQSKKSVRSAYRCVHCSVGAYKLTFMYLAEEEKSCQKEIESETKKRAIDLPLRGAVCVGAFSVLEF